MLIDSYIMSQCKQIGNSMLCPDGLLETSYNLPTCQLALFLNSPKLINRTCEHNYFPKHAFRPNTFLWDRIDTFY